MNYNYRAEVSPTFLEPPPDYVRYVSSQQELLGNTGDENDQITVFQQRTYENVRIQNIPPAKTCMAQISNFFFTDSIVALRINQFLSIAQMIAVIVVLVALLLIHLQTYRTVIVCAIFLTISLIYFFCVNIIRYSLRANYCTTVLLLINEIVFLVLFVYEAHHESYFGVLSIIQ